MKSQPDNKASDFINRPILPTIRPVRLPFSTRTPDSTTVRATTSQIEQTTCGICGKVKSKYVCPRCNVFYCSLDCFRSEKHSQCSEPFYRSIIQSEIASNPTANPEEKLRMMELLKRFEEGQDVLAGSTHVDGEADEDGAQGGRVDPRMMEEALLGLRGEGEGAAGADEGEGPDEDEEAGEEEALQELRANIADIDIDALPPDELLALLPPAYREKFLSLLDQPESEEARALMEEVGEASGGEGWWKLNGVSGGSGDEGENEEGGISISGAEHGAGGNMDFKAMQGRTGRPMPLSEEDLAGITVSDLVAAKLLYNTFAVCLSYIHLLPYHLLLPCLSFHLAPLSSAIPPPASSASSSAEELRGFRADLAKAVPFLEDPKSTIRLGSVGTVVDLAGGYLFKEDTAASLAALNEIKPLITPPLDLNISHPFLLILSDLHRLYTSSALYTPGKNKSPAYANHAARKIAFYAQAVREIERQAWDRLQREVVAVMEDMRDAGVVGEEEERSELTLSTGEVSTEERGAKITLLPSEEER